MSSKGKICKRRAFFYSLSVLLLGLDLSTKELANSYLRKPIPIIGRFLSFRLLHNSGGVLGILSSCTWAVGVIEALGCLAFAMGLALAKRRSVLAAFSLGLAGGSGNLADRIIHAHGFLNGYVVDFIDYGWFIGNLADVYLFLSAILICVSFFVPFGSQNEKSAADS